MDEIVMLTNLGLFLILAAICSIVFNKIKLPPLIGYIMAGIIIANIWQTSEAGETVVNILADMGLIMLMYCIGLEINLKKIRKQGLFAIEIALVQLPLMVLGGVIAGTFMGFDVIQSLCFGAIISGSSTAVVMAVLKTQNHLNKEQVETIVLITIMEDIGQVIILSIITPVMAGSGLDSNSLLVMILSIATFIITSIVIGLRFMPRVTNWVSDNVSSEVLIVFSVGLAFGMSLLAHYAGLSVAIGAFLIGMMMSSSRKSKYILNSIEPMKDIFMAMFFISIGMAISIDSLVSNILMIIAFYLIFALLKSSTVFLGYWLGNENPRTGFLSAVGLIAMGEFAFIISKQALDYGIVDSTFYTTIIGAALISMISLPILSKNSATIWDKATSACPAGAMVVFNNIDRARDVFYSNISNSSARTRKEFYHIMTHTYICILIIIVMEISFILVNKPLFEWAAEYIGGNILFWIMLGLLVNLFSVYIPTYVIINNLRFAGKLGRLGSSKSHDMGGTARDHPQLFTNMNTSMLSLMVSILILLCVPNNIGFWEHIGVLMLAFVLLILFHRHNLRNKEESVVHDEEEETMDTEEFIKLIKIKQQNELGEDPVDAEVPIFLKEEEE